MSDFEFKVSQKGTVAHIDLSRPNEGNALTRGMMFQLAQALRASAQDPSIHLVVIESSGDYFCKGRDGKGESRAGMTPYEIRVNMMGAVLDVYKAISDVPVPVVAKVHADAVGFGSAMAVACDLTLASSQVKFSFPEIEHDIPPTMAMCAALGKIPAKALSYLIYSAESVDALEAKQLGIASKVYAQASFEMEVNAFIEKLSSKPRLVLETIKKYQEKATHASPDMALEYAGTLLALVRS
jgi:2-(1,2-epoxy-1,2-dihydrophenyl)acetyl-CoA isomerase